MTGLPGVKKQIPLEETQSSPALVKDVRRARRLTCDARRQLARAV